MNWHLATAFLGVGFVVGIVLNSNGDLASANFIETSIATFVGAIAGVSFSALLAFWDSVNERMSRDRNSLVEAESWLNENLNALDFNYDYARARRNELQKAPLSVFTFSGWLSVNPDFPSLVNVVNHRVRNACLMYSHHIARIRTLLNELVSDYDNVLGHHPKNFAGQVSNDIVRDTYLPVYMQGVKELLRKLDDTLRLLESRRDMTIGVLAAVRAQLDVAPRNSRLRVVMRHVHTHPDFWNRFEFRTAEMREKKTQKTSGREFDPILDFKLNPETPPSQEGPGNDTEYPRRDAPETPSDGSPPAGRPTDE